MTTKRTGNRDNRVEPLPAGTPADSVTNYKVDRVFAPATRARPTDTASEAANTSTIPPGISGATTGETATAPVADGELELSLRRQLSRLQRQLAEAQRELANKDDELAAEVEKRFNEQNGLEQLAEDNRQLRLQIEDLQGFETKTKGIEQRMQDSLAAYAELTLRLDQERKTAFAANARVDELTRAFDEARRLWNAERTMLEVRTTADAAQAEDQRKAALEVAEAALAAATTRQREAHEAEVAELKQAHERSLSTLRGELEPKALEARGLAEERERLASVITALKNEATRTATEHDEAHARELRQLSDAHTAELGVLTRTAAAELSKVIATRDLQILGQQQLVRSGEAREQSLEETASTLRQTQLEIQRELTESKERITQLEGDLASLEGRRALAQLTTEKVLEQQRVLKGQLESSTAESRRAEMDRRRFVAFLEEGLALLGALPPAEGSTGESEVASPLPPDVGRTVTFR